jgi:hypothetical protein
LSRQKTPGLVIALKLIARAEAVIKRGRLLAHRIISARCGIWSLSRHSRRRSSPHQARFMNWRKSPIGLAEFGHLSEIVPLYFVAPDAIEARAASR